jgi:hypothetical protein
MPRTSFTPAPVEKVRKCYSIRATFNEMRSKTAQAIWGRGKTGRRNSPGIRETIEQIVIYAPGRYEPIELEKSRPLREPITSSSYVTPFPTQRRLADAFRSSQPFLSVSAAK